MITRRQFSKVTGGTILSTCLPLSAFAVPPPLNIRSIGVFGVGGAGCNIIELLRREVRLNANCSIHTFNRTPDQRPGALGFSTHLDCQLTAEEAGLVLDVVGKRDVVFLFAGLGGAAGTKLTPFIGSIAKCSGATVIAVVVMPFDFEGSRRNTQAQLAKGELADLIDRVHVIENNVSLDNLPDMTFERGLEHVNRLAIRAFVLEAAHMGASA